MPGEDRVVRDEACRHGFERRDARRDEALCARIKQVFDDNYRVDGARKVCQSRGR